MDPRGEQIGQRGVDPPLAIDPAKAGEALGHDLDGEMALAARIMAGVTGMAGTVVLHDQPCRREGGLQPRLDLGRNRPLRMLRHPLYIAFEGDPRSG